MEWGEGYFFMYMYTLIHANSNHKNSQHTLLTVLPNKFFSLPDLINHLNGLVVLSNTYTQKTQYCYVIYRYFKSLLLNPSRLFFFILLRISDISIIQQYTHIIIQTCSFIINPLHHIPKQQSFNSYM